MAPETMELVLRQYLLDEIDEESRLRLEEQLVTDPAVHDQLEAVAMDLADDYLDGLLGPRDRRLYERHVLVTQLGREQVQFVEALRARAQARRGGNAIRNMLATVAAGLTVRPVVSVCALAIVVISIGGIALYVRQRGEVARVADAPAVAGATSQQHALGSSSSAAAPSPPSSPQASKQPPSDSGKPDLTIVAITLSPGMSRGNGQTARVHVTNETRTVRLDLVAGHRRAGRYTTEITDPDGREVFTAPASSDAAGPISLSVPANRLPPGDYRVALIDDAGETLATYTVRIQRP